MLDDFLCETRQKRQPAERKRTDTQITEDYMEIIHQQVRIDNTLMHMVPRECDRRPLQRITVARNVDTLIGLVHSENRWQLKQSWLRDVCENQIARISVPPLGKTGNTCPNEVGSNRNDQAPRSLNVELRIEERIQRPPDARRQCAECRR
jgi:hypothetical protein